MGIDPRPAAVGDLTLVIGLTYPVGSVRDPDHSVEADHSLIFVIRGALGLEHI
jgi:hypothetical protein